MSDTFGQILEQIARLARQHPDYRFEYIHAYTSQLAPELDPAPWIEHLELQWQALPLARQEACRQIFDYALLQARQATYQPVNELDLFLERQLYGIQDEQVVHKGAVSQALKQLEDRGNKRPAGRTPAAPAAGRTNPLNPRQLPKPPEGERA